MPHAPGLHTLTLCASCSGRCLDIVYLCQSFVMHNWDSLSLHFPLHFPLLCLSFRFVSFYPLLSIPPLLFCQFISFPLSLSPSLLSPSPPLPPLPPLSPPSLLTPSPLYHYSNPSLPPTCTVSLQLGSLPRQEGSKTSRKHEIFSLQTVWNLQRAVQSNWQQSGVPWSTDWQTGICDMLSWLYWYWCVYERRFFLSWSVMFAHALFRVAETMLVTWLWNIAQYGQLVRLASLPISQACVLATIRCSHSTHYTVLGPCVRFSSICHTLITWHGVYIYNIHISLLPL